MLSSSSSSKIGTRRSLKTAKFEKTFKRGSLMFIEGDTSSEMYILKQGKVRILKQEGDNTIELAVLGPGSVLGELSLLDHQPRGATAQVVEEITATVINEEILQATLRLVPTWLTNIVQLVVKRLRDTMKKVSDDVVTKNIAGVIKVILLLHESEPQKLDDSQVLYLKRIKERVYATIGLGGVETESVFLHLILKEMIVIRKNDLGEEYLILLSPAVLQMYLTFLRAKQRNAPIAGENLSAEASELLETIIAAGEKSGKRIREKIIKIGMQPLQIEIERQGKGRHIDPEALDDLVKNKVVIREEDATESKYGTHKRASIIYNTDTILRMKRLQKWLPVFKEEVQL